MWSVAIIWISQLYMFRNVFFFPLLKISRDKISFSKPVHPFQCGTVLYKNQRQQLREANHHLIQLV